jgi:ankyrin repeat protein
MSAQRLAAATSAWVTGRASVAVGGSDGGGSSSGSGDSGGRAIARRAALVADVEAAQATLDGMEAARIEAAEAALLAQRAAEAKRSAALAALDAHDASERRLAEAVVARAVAASSAERAACEARFAAARAAAAAAGVPAPLSGPAADSALGEALLDVLPLAFRHGHALALCRLRFLCGLTLRRRAVTGGAVATPLGDGKLVERRADGVRAVRLKWATLYTRERVDERGFLGGPADVMARALEQQAPAWFADARGAPRKKELLPGHGKVARTTSLIRAAATGDEQRVRELLAAGAPLRCVDTRRWTALHYASWQGSASVVVALLEAGAARAAGAMVDVQTVNGDTALVQASWQGHNDVVHLLLECGARQEMRNVHGMAALHCAASKCHAGIVEQLCAAPGAAATVALKNKHGRTPLALAVSEGGCSERLVAALLSADAAGATVDALSDKGDTALTWASNRGYEGAVRLLLSRGARQELQNDDGASALHCAASNSHAGIVEQLCAAPGAAAAVVLKNKDRNTALMFAALDGSGSERLVAALLSADATGATVDVQNVNGDTALILASWQSHEGAVRLLLARGARQDLQNCKHGGTSLHLAVSNGHAGIVEQLCAAQGAAATVALKNKRGRTPLALAIFSGGCSERIVVALLSADTTGVTVDALSDKGDTALTWASNRGYEGAVRLLLSRGARQELQNDDGATALHCASEEGHAGIVEQLCAAPGAAAAVTLKNKHGRTPLALAVSDGGGGERLVAALLAADAEGTTAGVLTDDGDSALIWASGRGHEGAVRLLLARGAWQDLQNKDGGTALHWAVFNGRSSIVELLCTSPGAATALSLRNNKGDTPLALALRTGRSAIASVLRAHGAS